MTRAIFQYARGALNEAEADGRAALETLPRRNVWFVAAANGWLAQILVERGALDEATRIVNEAQLQYNAMQIGVFQLLRDRERQVDTAVAYVEVLREYWTARADLQHVPSGRLPVSSEVRPGGMSVSGRRKKEDGHGQ